LGVAIASSSSSSSSPSSFFFFISSMTSSPTTPKGAAAAAPPPAALLFSCFYPPTHTHTHTDRFFGCCFTPASHHIPRDILSISSPSSPSPPCIISPWPIYLLYRRCCRPWLLHSALIHEISTRNISTRNLLLILHLLLHLNDMTQ
jgi:hypothetical protein